VVTSDSDMARRITQLINFGIDPETRTSVTAGLNAKMSELHAATGLAMLDRYQDALSRRRATARQLQTLLAAHPLTYQTGSDLSTWQVFQLVMPTHESRQRALTLASAHAIEVRTCFDPPLHRHPAFAGAEIAGVLGVTEDVAARTLSLPMANTLGPRQMARLHRLMDAAFAAESCSTG
jgi:dTDP-4-amino-4,6-dideoxygalactose transaminase